MSEKIRDSFIFYRSFYQSAKKLPKEDKAELFDAICSYALDGELVEMSVVPEAIFTVIKPNLDANRRKWENGCKEKKKISEIEADEEQEISKDEAKDKQTTSKPQGNVDVNVDVDKDVKSKSESESQFESFWEFYIPVKTKDGYVRKGSKEQSKVAFAKALKKNSFEKIMAALESYLIYCQQNNRFTKNASSWLKEGDFEITDETCIIAETKKPESTQNLIFKDF
jgi:hypothetical protein